MKKSKGIRIWPSFSRNHFGLKRFPGSFGFSLVLGYLFLTTVFFCHPIIKEPSLLPYVIHGKNKNFPALQSADSLALFISKEIALDRFESLEPAYRDEPEVHRYIHSRIISLKAQLDRPDSSALNSNYELRPNDIFDAMAAYDIQYNLKPNTIIIEPLKELASHQSGFYPKVMALNRIGQFYKNVCFDLDSSWFYYGAARDTLEKIGPITLEHIHCYENLLTLSIYKRKNLDAIMYGNELCDFERYSWKPDSVEMARALINRAFVLFREGDHRGSKLDDSLAMALLDSSKDIKEYQLLLRNEIIFSWHFDSEENFNKNHKALTYSVRMSKKDFVNINRLTANYLVQEKTLFREAIPYLNQALKYELHQEHHNFNAYSNICALFSSCYINTNQFGLAQSYIAKMEYLDNLSDEPSIYNFIKNNPESPFSFITAYNCADLFFTKYKITKRDDDLHIAYKYIELVNEIIYKQYKIQDEFSILQFYAEESSKFFTLSIEIAYELYTTTRNIYYLEKFTQFSEKSKNSLMHRDMVVSDKRNFAFLNDLIKIEINLRSKIKSEMIKGLRNNNKFGSILIEYNKIGYKIKSIDLKYSNNQIMSQVESLKQIQNKIDNNTSILNITQASDKIYFVFFNKDSIGTIALNSDSIQSRISQILNSTMDIEMLSNTFQWDITDNLLYKSIFPEHFVKYFKNNIIIIPDGIFNRIPLSALFKNTKNISLSPSIKSIKEEYDTSKFTGRVVAFSFSNKKTILSKNRSPLVELPGSYKEVLKLSKDYSKIKIYSGYNATKRNFINSYTDPSVDYIHLAVHGISNSAVKDDVKLYFRKREGEIDSLYGFELLGLQSSVKKIVLSSCQSATGKYIKAEGDFSLIRYFLINGAKEVYASDNNLIDNNFQNYRHYYYK